MPNLTFIATINSVIMAGLRPVLCEINEDSLCLDLKKLKNVSQKNESYYSCSLIWKLL